MPRHPDSDGEDVLQATVDDYLQEKSKQGTGNYRRNAGRILNRWLDFLEDRGVASFDEITVQVMEQYARFLNRRASAEDGIAGSTAQKYFDYVRAFLTWASTRGYLETNHAKHDRVAAALPEAAGRSEHRQQFWSPEQRRAIVSHVSERAHSAIENADSVRDAASEIRDRALVAIIAYSGVRGGEVLRDRHDARRDGLKWRDVDLETQTIEVLGKGSQEWVQAGLPDQAASSLERLYAIAEPPSGDWPVFTSFHRPTLASRARDALASEYGVDSYDAASDDVAERVEDALEDADSYLSVLRETGTPPKSLTTAGGRSIMKRLSKEADVPDLDTDSGEYLELHGGRRGAGDTLVREQGWEQSQALLRHASPKTTMELYSDIAAKEVADDASVAFERADDPTSSGTDSGGE